LLVIALFLLPLAQTRAFAQSGSDQYGQPYSGGQSGYDQQQPYSDSGQGYPQQEYSQQPSQGLRNDVQPLSAGQLEQLVAPIALYPDALVAQVLAASTYPQQVADADRWRQAERYAPPEQIAAGADVQPWDPSVKALTAFPQVLAQMQKFIADKMKKEHLEMCYGINAAAKNDCGTAAHSCMGHAAQARDPSSFVLVPAGLCTKIDGGSLKPA